MSTQKVFLIIIAIYLVGFFGHALALRKTVYGDGRYYYAWVRSVVVDHDINFRNEYGVLQIHEPITARGLSANKFSIGTPLLWLPTFVTVHQLIRGNGWSLPYQLAIGLTSVFAALAGLIFCLRSLKLSPHVGALIIALLALGTNLLFYGSLDPVNSHAVSFFVASVLVNLAMSPTLDSFAFGIFLALLASIRLQDSVFLLLLAPRWKHIHVRGLLAGFIIGFLPQITAWFMLNGSLTNPYISGGERFDFLHPHVLGVLFSASNGLFLWTPVVAVGLAGLAIMWRKRWNMLTVFIAELIIVSSWSTWWQGASVSGRMFVSSLPLVAVGLATIIQRLYRNRIIRVSLALLVGTLCVLNTLGMLFYLATN